VLPERPVVHLDAGYDWQLCRQALAERDMLGEVATRGMPAPIQASRRWSVERTHAWATSTASCAGAPSVAGWWWSSGWYWSTPSSSAAAAAARLELLPLACPTLPSALTPPGAGP
jgi:IS5 family transposase